MNYYIQGDAANADKIKAAFEELGYFTDNVKFAEEERLYFTVSEQLFTYCLMNGNYVKIIMTHPDYKELELPKPHYDIANFKPFDKVLIRVGNKSKWTCDFFSHYHKGFHCVGCDDWSQCIPYEGNEHLLGTTDMCGEEFINW